MSAPLEAQLFSGTWTVDDGVGGVLVLELMEGRDRAVTGVLANAGVSYVVEGRLEDEVVIGLIRGEEGPVHFAAERWEDELWLELYGTGPDGGPDYDEVTEIDFVRAGSASGTGAGTRPGVGGAQDQGAPAGGPPGSRGPGTAPGAATDRPLAPGFTEDHPQVREWIAFLSGKKLTRMSSYSSGSAGGYSARTDLYLCSDRSYALRDESSVSVDVGGAFGNSGGTGTEQGRWRVITNGQVVGLILESREGGVSEVRLDYRNQQTFVNGERVYVTPAEVCMQ